MFLFGHLGIGSKLATPFSAGLPRKALLLGTMLPDLIDKPIYYSLVLVTGKRGAELGMLCGTRLFGHTALMLVGVLALATLRRSRALAALALGVATHLLLDNLGDHFNNVGGAELVALLWPLKGLQFPIYPFQNAGDHLMSLLRPYTFGGELVGLAILSWDWWKVEHKQEILTNLWVRRFHRRRAKKRGVRNL